jgi:hypothetical protein
MGILNPFLEEWFWRIFIQKLLSSNSNSEFWKILISFEFSFYHFFVITYFSTWNKAIFLTILIFFGGRILLYIKETLGYLVASLVHLGADMAIITIALLIVYYVNHNKEIPFA